MTNWSPEIGKQRGPRYLAIADRLARDVTEGRLKTGDRLPTHRDLAWKLGVTVGTVTRAYAEAERRGLIVGEVGRGTFIRERNAEAGLLPAAARSAPGFIDFSRNFPAEHGQSRAIAAALVEVAQANDFATMLGYATTTGLPQHREAAAQWLRREGFEVDPAEVVITGGAQHAMMLALHAVARPGDVVLTEELTFYGLKSIANMLSLRLSGVACDGEGLLPDALDAACRLHSPKALYALPTLQNPTTATMSAPRREAIAEICRRHGVTIIEDDIYGFLAPEAPPPLAAFAPELTVYLVSLSKSIAPGLRLGFVRAPEPLQERLAGGMRASLWMAPPILADVATRLIRTGVARRLAEGQRNEAIARQAIARRILAGATMTAPSYAIHLWLHLPEPWRREEFAAAARRRGVGVASADAFAVGRASVPHAVRVCVSAPGDRGQVERGLGILAELLRDGPATGSPMV
ncbi:MAG: PLP-dependent aminotransferase family protein [Alphaproteobacteria bacterium]|nr:PLP-dependent aminotransferase family protein [Alphaproteobacteria bacterium]